jgi:hypothetical protein
MYSTSPAIRRLTLLYHRSRASATLREREREGEGERESRTTLYILCTMTVTIVLVLSFGGYSLTLISQFSVRPRPSVEMGQGNMDGWTVSGQCNQPHMVRFRSNLHPRLPREG